jgi:alkyldihydroxyacetonephosphate synthase
MSHIVEDGEVIVVEHMKWWGWGKPEITFDHAGKPYLAPFLREAIALDVDAPRTQPPTLDQLQIPDSGASAELVSRLGQIVGEEYVTAEPEERVVHTYGKSLRDLVRIRADDLGRVPDVVVYPGSEEEVADLVTALVEANAVLIPFGGGSNISGSLEAPRSETRTVVSVDLGRMGKVLHIDEEARTARIQAGALGPSIEEQLGALGWTLGHFPDSFTHSSLGGWIATRSSGMQSDKYGDIADLTRAVRVVTPAGILATRAVPSTSTGPSVREMILGSEGRLGIITEATVQIHRIPAERTILGYFFPDWERALLAMREISTLDSRPSVTRVSDAKETKFSLATRKASSGLSSAVSKGLMKFLERAKGFDLDKLCLSFIGFEGSPSHVRAQRRAVGRIVSRHGGVCVGTGPGVLYDQKKFDTPYIRDFLLDYGALGDVSETSAPWSGLQEVYDNVVRAANKAFAEIGVVGWIMCHLSHSYHSGACLYFTFAFKPNEEHAPVEQYDVVKGAIQQAFIDHGATLSHHHAVGTEHSRWLSDDISPTGVHFVQALVNGVDPGANFNPGKIVN